MPIYDPVFAASQQWQRMQNASQNAGFNSKICAQLLVGSCHLAKGVCKIALQQLTKQAVKLSSSLTGWRGCAGVGFTHFWIFFGYIVIKLRAT